MGLKKLNLEGKILTLLEEKGGNQPYAIKTGKTYLNKSQKTTSVKGKG